MCITSVHKQQPFVGNSLLLKKLELLESRVIQQQQQFNQLVGYCFIFISGLHQQLQQLQLVVSRLQQQVGGQEIPFSLRNLNRNPGGPGISSAPIHRQPTHTKSRGQVIDRDVMD